MKRGRNRGMLRRLRVVLPAVAALALLLAPVGVAGASSIGQVGWTGGPGSTDHDVLDGNLYFTSYINHGTCSSNCQPNVFSTSYHYDGAGSFVLQEVYGTGDVVHPLAITQGADGIVWNPNDHQLLIGGQFSDKVFEVDPYSTTVQQVYGNGVQTNVYSDNSFHLTVSPDGSLLYTEGEPHSKTGQPGNLSAMPLQPNLSQGQRVSLTGSDTSITGLAFLPGHNNQLAYYTHSGPGGGGHIGILDLTTMTTYKVDGLDFGHGITYDPYTGDFFISGENHIAQYHPDPVWDPTADNGNGGWVDNGYVVGTFTGLSFNSHFDQIDADGMGHLFAANNGGYLFFIDYSQSKNIGNYDYGTAVFLTNDLDDIVNQLPEVPYAIILPLLMVPAAWWFLRRRRARNGDGVA